MSKVFAVAVSAYKAEGSRHVSGMCPGYQIGATSRQESVGYAMELALEKMPREEGWTAHKVEVVEIPQSVLREACGLEG